MTYGILLKVVSGGWTLQSVMDEPDTSDPDLELPDLMLDESGRAVWDRIVDRVTWEVGAVEVDEYPKCLELWRHGPAGSFQLCYYGESAGIEIPYRYPGAAALPIMSEAYLAAAIVAEETGMVAFDFEVGQTVVGGDVAKAAARLGGVAEWVRDSLS